MSDTPVFTIEDGIAIPARTLPNAGPRESMYPLDSLKEGQGFAIPVADGKASRQKQSQMSSLAKTRGISLVTRFFDGENGNDSPFKSVPAPCLGVWHNGPAKEKKPRKTKDQTGAPANEGSTAPLPPTQPADAEAPLEL